MKICTKCKISKSLDQFSKSSFYKDGLQYKCKQCERFYVKQWKEKNLKKYQDYQKLWKQDNPDAYKKWMRQNKENRRIYLKHYKRKRFKEDIYFKLSTNLRNRLRIAIKNNYKSGSAIRDLGCSIFELKCYLESKFKKGMTWKNHGKKWHMDHIKPFISFDLTKKSELSKACHYTNLQPLWISENLKKGIHNVL